MRDFRFILQLAYRASPLYAHKYLCKLPDIIPIPNNLIQHLNCTCNIAGHDIAKANS